MDDEKNESQLINSWIFEYLAHRCVKRYFSDGCDGGNLTRDIEVLSSSLNTATDRDARECTYLLFLHLLCMEEGLVESENQIDCDYIDEENFMESVTHCIAFSSQDTCDEDTRKLSRTCLIHSYVVNFKNHLKHDSGWKEALKSFQDFVTLLPVEECKEMYDKCAKMNKVDPKDNFISDYMKSLRQLVGALYAEFDDPKLIKFARCKDLVPQVKTDAERQNGKIDDAENTEEYSAFRNKRHSPTDDEIADTDELMCKSTTDLDILLKDRRPSKKSDLEEIRQEECGFSEIRKKINSFNKESHLHIVRLLEKRIRKKPPSHQNTRVGPWMPEEEKAFVEKTLEIGVGQWKKIKDALNTYRSSQQLKDKWRQIKPHYIMEVKNQMK